MPGLASQFETDAATVQLTVSLYLLGLAVAQLCSGRCPTASAAGR